MTSLRTTVIMKTDISGSTVRFRALAEADLHALLTEHREFLSRHAAAHDGRIVKPEGDGFWLAFPSVTAAALAAMAMQEELRLAQPNKGDDRCGIGTSSTSRPRDASMRLWHRLLRCSASEYGRLRHGGTGPRGARPRPKVVRVAYPH